MANTKKPKHGERRAFSLEIVKLSSQPRSTDGKFVMEVVPDDIIASKGILSFSGAQIGVMADFYGLGRVGLTNAIARGGATANGAAIYCEAGEPWHDGGDGTYTVSHWKLDGFITVALSDEGLKTVDKVMQEVVVQEVRDMQNAANANAARIRQRLLGSIGITNDTEDVDGDDADDDLVIENPVAAKRASSKRTGK